TTEEDLRSLFSKYGSVKFTKIIVDRNGVSKGYGFVTFETEEEAKQAQKVAENIVLKDRKLNIAPAVKKQPFTRVYDTPVVSNGSVIVYHNGIPYVYQNPGSVVLNPEPTYHFQQPQATYPMVYAQPVYLPQQYQFHHVTPGVPTHCVYPSAAAHPPAGTSASTPEMYQIITVPVSSNPLPGTPAYTTNQAATTGPIHVLEHPENSHSDGAAAEQENRVSYSSRPNSAGEVVCGSPSNMVASVRVTMTGNPMMQGAGDATRGYTLTENCGHQAQFMSKSVSGVTVMAYPAPVVLARSTSLSKISAEKGYEGVNNNLSDCNISSNMTAEALTPPPTPVTRTSQNGSRINALVKEMTNQLQTFNL
ncbi:polyadenylate-binding protein, cytoplasmic and nuclear-like, partial [Limulus polyphemus]|uniref:Polyadenylate-binding protein, cytoplasmic and nuclear-like n=1 Tax=Limulus polyphemus TaxID=6850 RepID=A0ABM1TJS8_LIMPO